MKNTRLSHLHRNAFQLLAATTLLLASSLATTQADDSGLRTTQKPVRSTLNPNSDDRYRNARDMERPYFRDNETSLDAFGAYFDASGGKGLFKDGWGGGLGVNHFFTKYVGLGLEGYWWDGDRTGEVVSSGSGSVILRYPIESIHLAPYIFGGVGGHLCGNDQISEHGGVGLEYRLTHNIGVFSDARYVFADESNDFAMGRLGVRYAF